LEIGEDLATARGKAWSEYAWRELPRQDARRSGKEDAKHTWMARRFLFVFHAERNNKIERGFLGT